MSTAIKNIRFRFDRKTLDRMVEAVELVRDRLLRATSALESAGIPYAVVGGNAVAAWVSQINKRAVRNTVDVDILLNRADIPDAAQAMKTVGLIYRHAAGIDFFLDGPDGEFEECVHVVKADEKVRKEYLEPAPSVTDYYQGEEFRFLTLAALVRMKLTSYRIKDQVHLQDLCRIGLIDATWPAKFIPELGARLQLILDNPDG